MITPEDRLQILALFARYNSAIDSGDAEGWSATFVDGGIFHHPARPWAGASELRQFITERTAKLQSAPVGDQRHWNDAITIDGSDQKAAATCELLVVGVSKSDGSAVVIARGRYQDRLRREEAGWRFVERRLEVQ